MFIANYSLLDPQLTVLPSYSYRAHGRIGPYKALPAHCEIVLEKPGDNIAKEAEDKPKKITPQAAAKQRKRIAAGGGTDLLSG